MRRHRCAPILLSALAAACSSGGGDVGPTGEARPRGDFVLLSSDPTSGQVIYLNDPIAFDFSEPVDVESANLTTVSFSVLDATGVPGSEFVHGAFHAGTRPGDDEPGRRLLFVPRYASDNDFQNGGLRGGATYRVQLVGGSARNGTALQSVYGRPLEQPATIEFSTVEGTQPPQLFRNPKSGGPRRTGFSIDTAASLDDVPLGLFGQPRLRVRLTFDQALNPNDRNVPVALDIDPRVRGEEHEGRIWLEYKDPELDDPSDPTDFTWIPAEVLLERNDLDGADVVLEPLGVLPNDVEMRVMVAAELEDIAGEHNLDTPGYDPVFATFHTRAGYGQQWNAIVEDFRELRDVDLGAVFAEAGAEIGSGFVRAGFDFGGSTTTLDFTPTNNEIVLDTSFTQLIPDNGLPFSVVGGVFKLRNVTIPQGVTVRGQGPNPMVWKVNGRFTVAGTLTVSGGNGARVDTLRVANIPKAGGIGVCGGGSGGQGTPSGIQRDARGETGRGPGQAAGTGGRGGLLACNTICYNNPDPSFYNGSGGGSGGGGGGMATRGDLDWLGLPANFLENVLPNVSPTVNTTFQQLFGYGGAGCSGGTGARSSFLAGGEPGDLVFTDTRADNDFWGSAIDLNRQLRIAGELQVPVGGGGGGGGGDPDRHVLLHRARQRLDLDRLALRVD
ncbi:MAG: Ig-like domain-containing protein, partial [Planctomycetota bacterium]